MRRITQSKTLPNSRLMFRAPQSGHAHQSAVPTPPKEWHLPTSGEILVTMFRAKFSTERSKHFPSKEVDRISIKIDTHYKRIAAVATALSHITNFWRAIRSAACGVGLDAMTLSTDGTPFAVYKSHRERLLQCQGAFEAADEAFHDLITSTVAPEDHAARLRAIETSIDQHLAIDPQGVFLAVQVNLALTKFQ